MRLHYDISSGTFVSGWASNTSLRASDLSIKRGDALSIEFVPFRSLGLAQAEKHEVTALECGFFVQDAHGSIPLFAANSFVASLEDVDGVEDARRVYTGRPSSASLEVSTQFVGMTTHKTNSGAAYTLIGSDADKLLALTHSSAIVLTLANAVAIGDSLVVLNNSTGQALTLAAGTGISTITYVGVDETIVSGVVRLLTRTSSTEWTVTAVDEASSIEVDLEFSWTEDSEPLSTPALTITLHNDYLRETDATPEALGTTSNYVTLGDFQSALDLKADQANLTKTYLGLGNVSNTSDANKPISTATQTALDLKQNALPDVITAGAKAFPASITFSAKGLATAASPARRVVMTTGAQVIASTAVVDGPSLTLTDNLAVGDVFEVVYFGRTKNGTTASTVRFDLLIGATVITGPSFAMGTTAATDVPFSVRAHIVAVAVAGNVDLEVIIAANWKTSTASVAASLSISQPTVITGRMQCTVAAGTQMNVDAGHIAEK